MKMVAIPKRSGKTRMICIPDAETKRKLRSMVGRLEAKARRICPTNVIHGFTRGRSPVTNAVAHVGHRYTLSMDLEDFFDDVSARTVAGKLTKDEIAACLIDPGDGRGARALQGLPTSPAVANIAASAIDRAILRAIDKHKMRIVYTRYADDLTFSFDAPVARQWLLQTIPAIVGRCGFRVAKRKTRYMPASAGRRHVTGVAVDDDGVHPTRAVKRKLRAARRQAVRGVRHAAERARGLEEWTRLKPPKPIEPPTEAIAAHEADWDDVALALAKHWGLGSLPYRPTGAQDEVAKGGYLITRDPAYVLGASTYTTSWTSCLRQPDGAYRHSVKTWLGLAGTSVAALLSDRTAAHAGVERRVMRARCWLHLMRDGRLGYDRCRGDARSIAALKAWLAKRGAHPVARLGRDARVVGNVSRRGVRPWSDSLRAIKATIAGRQVWVFGPK